MNNYLKISLHRWSDCKSMLLTVQYLKKQSVVDWLGKAILRWQNLHVFLDVTRREASVCRAGWTI